MTPPLSQRYFPAFSTRENELRAYSNLTDAAKHQMVPAVTLTRDVDGEAFEGSLEGLLEAAAGRAVVLDFDPVFKVPTSDEVLELRRQRKEERLRLEGKASKPATERQKEAWARQRTEARAAIDRYNRRVAQLLSPAGGYAAWCALGLSAPNLIPVVQLADLVEARRLVETVTSVGRMVAFRVRLHDPKSVANFLFAAGGLKDPTLGIVILDAGYVRLDIAAGERQITEALDLANRALGGPVFDALTKVCMAGSFPSSLKDMPTTLRIVERDLFDRLAEKWDVRYGDHASVHPRVAEMFANGWFPHVDVAHAREWHFQRGDKNRASKDYIKLSNQLVSKPAIWAPKADCWGSETVERAAAGVLTDASGVKMTSPGPWMGVRISQHLSQQAFLP